ncbi:MAG: aminotransferase class V-fold PLP-dependent enzyme [Anaerovorax sp.]|nr:aminotransferase class V-fold PLP-dependent enzyme [Anaerovorax sp.]
MSIQLFKPTYHIEECLSEIRECFEKGWTGLGFKTIEFEERWKEYTGHKYAHFLNSSTSGLHLAVKILKEQNNWENGDEVITTPLTFVSTNHAIKYENLNPVFADVDEYLCLDPKSVELLISNRTRAIMFVGYGGRVGEILKIIEICKNHNLKLILDAAHMAGTRMNGITPGTLKGVDVTVYSYQAVKNLPTADSGMICFATEKEDELCRKLSWLGINKDTFARTNEKGGYKWKYDVDYLGYKYHGNSIMASIGIVQLKYLDEENAMRRKMVKEYNKLLSQCEKISPVLANFEEECCYHIYAIEVERRDELMAYLQEKGVYAGVHYIENTQYSIYLNEKKCCQNVIKKSQNIISLPLHLQLSFSDIEYVAGLIIEFYEK